MRLEKIFAYVETVELGVEQAKRENEHVTFLKVGSKKKYVHSKYNPRQGAMNLINKEGVNEETIWIIFGLGLGYVAEELLKIVGTKGKIIIVEPTEALVQKQTLYINSLLKDKRIILFSGKSQEQLEKILEQNIKVKDLNNIKLIIEPTYEEYFKEYYVAITKFINEYLNNLKVSFDTYNQFIERNLRNIILNKEYIAESNDIAMYHNKYKNIPALIVSAGPSLNKNLEHIKDFKGIIFSGTRTLHHIKEVGVSPHFLVCADPGKIAHDILRDFKDNEVNLIATEYACAEVVKDNNGQKHFVTGNKRKTSEKMFDLKLPYMEAFGSVANLSLSIAQFMGCNPIIFIGQDLAYTDMKAHVDNFKSHDINTEPLTYVKGVQEEVVATSTSLLLFLRWMEKFIRATKNETTYYNCTEGGAWIEGAEHRCFKEIVDVYSGEYDIEYIHQGLYSQKQKNYATKRYKKFALEGPELIKTIKKEIAELESLKEAYRHNLNDDQKTRQAINNSCKCLTHSINATNEIFKDIYLIECTKEEMQVHNKPKVDELVKDSIERDINKLINIYGGMKERMGRIQQIIEAVQ